MGQIIHDTDVLRVVNELWNAGAEAVTVNNRRVGPGTNYRCVGTTILVVAPAGALFAWVVHRFGSLWPAIGLHACLNLWWMVWHGPDARGVFTLDAPGIAQVGAVGFAFLLTFRKPRRALVIEQSAIGN